MLACSFSFFQNGLEPWPQTGFCFKKLLGSTQGIIIIINSKVVGYFFWGWGAPHRVCLNKLILKFDNSIPGP
jgi:hypothetical protein